MRQSLNLILSKSKGLGADCCLLGQATIEKELIDFNATNQMKD